MFSSGALNIKIYWSESTRGPHGYLEVWNISAMKKGCQGFLSLEKDSGRSECSFPLPKKAERKDGEMVYQGVL